MSSEHETRKQVEEDAHEDLELAEGDAEGIAGGDKAKERPIKYMEVKMKEVLITSVIPE
jgi:hypothetical protein